MPNKPTTLRELDERRKRVHVKGVCKCCDNWNEITVAHSTELLSKIEGMKFIRPDQFYPIGEYERIRNETIDQVISLINQNK